MSNFRCWLVLSVLLAACAPPPDEGGGWEVSAQPLNGNVFFPGGSCNEAQQGMIREAFGRAATQIFTAGGNTLTDCLKDGVQAGGVTLAGNTTYPEWITKRLQEGMPTEVYCADLPKASASAPLNISSEKVTFDRAYVDARIANQDAQTLTATVLHEVAHNKGYDHPKDTGSSGTQNTGTVDYSHSVPRELGWCSHHVSSGDGGGPGPRRSEVVGETTLAPVGLEGGYPGLNPTCAANDFAIGLGVRTGNSVNGVGMICSPPSGSPVDIQPIHGGAGGTRSDLRCFGGEMLVGLHGTAGAYVNSVGPICQSTANVTAGSIQGRFLDPTAGGTSGLRWTRTCPPFMAAKAVRLRSGSLIDRIELVCQDVRAPRAFPVSTLSTFGGAGNAQSHSYAEYCLGGAIMTELQVSHGGAIDRAAALCRPVVRGSQGLTWDNAYQPVPGHGGRGGAHLTQDCVVTPGATGKGAVVGLKMSSNGKVITSIQPVCTTDFVKWGNGTSTSKVYPPVAGGFNSANQKEVVCPVGQFIVGWTIQGGNTDPSGLTLVENIQGLCRKL